MSVTTINIPLEGKAAEVYRLAPLEKREWLEMLVNLVVREFAKYSSQSLLALMDEMSFEARSKDLTPEILESLLTDV
ncbi:MAG: hypothetical protein R3E79_20205 [Caldilineaceae bacterium]